MQNIKTNQSFELDDYRVTRLGSSAEDSKSDWVLLCVSKGGCTTCQDDVCPAKDSEDSCSCSKTHVHTWVKSGHCFSAGSKACRVTSTNRSETTFEEAHPNLCGAGDC